MSFCDVGRFLGVMRVRVMCTGGWMCVEIRVCMGVFVDQ